MRVMVFHGRLDEGHEYWLGILGSTLVLGMELHSYEEWMRGYLDYLGQSGLGIVARYTHAGGIETVRIFAVELERWR